ncbi:MAG: transcription termination/antitermination protein NusG [Candidatus Saganbacteria bacterium]|nr:transcription termination/antitermination protein NusG [Candidatus Saganbacteria bacterium]
MEKEIISEDREEIKAEPENEVQAVINVEDAKEAVEESKEETKEEIKEEIKTEAADENSGAEPQEKPEQSEAKAEEKEESKEEVIDEIRTEDSPAGETTEPEAKPEPRWYIVQTLTGQEDRVKERIEGSIEELGLKEKIFRVLVPEEETVEIKGNKRIERKRKMYPGYVFIEMALDEDTWYKIRSTAGVARFIGGKIKPQAVTDREMQRVLKQLGIKGKEIKVEFENGEPIRIISGSFRGYTGSVSEVIPAKSKLKAMINIFGRDTSVEVDFDRVEKIV